MERWIRPETSGDVFNGLNDSSIHTFKEKKYESLARETLQNSLDECLNEKKPVVVEYKSYLMDVSSIPGIAELIKFNDDNLKYWSTDSQENVVEYFKNAKSVLKEQKINVMRISEKIL